MFRCELNVSFCTDAQCFCCYPNNTNYTLWSIFVATGFIKRKLLLPRITIIRKFKTPCFHIKLKIEAWLNVYHLPIYLIGSCFCTLMMPKYEIRILMNEVIILRWIAMTISQLSFNNSIMIIVMIELHCLEMNELYHKSVYV